jgi:hypothetical protein
MVVQGTNGRGERVATAEAARRRSGRKRVHKILLAAIAILAVAGLSRPVMAARCPSGQITCAQWCAKYGTSNCMTGHPNSCDKKPNGAATCVHDRR